MERTEAPVSSDNGPLSLLRKSHFRISKTSHTASAPVSGKVTQLGTPGMYSFPIKACHIELCTSHLQFQPFDLVKSSFAMRFWAAHILRVLQLSDNAESRDVDNPGLTHTGPRMSSASFPSHGQLFFACSSTMSQLV